MPGVYINQASAKPGSDGATIRIRGVNTLSSANPLVLLDGVEYDIIEINPADIESISVLKDASATAIYGARGANAVIEIKTELAPLVLLDELMKIEAELGRDRSKKAKANGPRTIDLDLLWMDGETHGGKKLRLPHPLIGERDFVLVPLEDLMHDPARFFRYNGVEVKEPEDRVGHIVGELGRM